jgi:Ni,Fe-hydrogenase III large subunit
VISGARAGRPSALQRWLASTLPQELDAFIVPGAEILDVLALDPMAARLRLVANPRHASVLVLACEIPPALAHAAAVAYAQQPRPRAILSIGSPGTATLPTADVSVEASQSAVGEGVAELRRRLALGAWDPDPEAFVIDDAAPESGDGDQQHGHHAMSDSPGLAHMQMGAMDHSRMGEMDHAHMGAMDHGHMGEMDHAHMSGGGGFMSMVMMTRDLPRSADGLPMEWLEVPFGPLFPGLPGGLNLVLTLDGDTVVRAQVRGGTLARGLTASWPGPSDTFPNRLARLDPLASTTYRMLAWRALEQATGIEPDEREMRRRIAALECERVASHLTWLGRFGFLLGDAWLARGASAFSRAIRSADDMQVLGDVRHGIEAFLRRQRKTPLMRQRLHGVGRIEPESAHDLRGPVARACGRADDTRQGDPAYGAIGFEPVVTAGCDAHARLSVRLAEIEQSLDLIGAARIDGPPTGPKSAPGTGAGRADVETPRGRASLVVTLADGQVVHVALEVPSAGHVHLVETVVVNHELADALLGIASLDLSPWELDR